MSEHDFGTWRVSATHPPPGGAVVSDVDQGHGLDPDQLKYYGGHLVAESIVREDVARLIAAAPTMRAALLRAHGGLWDHEAGSDPDCYVCAALALAGPA